MICMTTLDRLEIMQGAVGYYRTVRNLQRNRGNEGRALAAQNEIDRLKFEIGQLKKQLKQEDAAWDHSPA